MPNRIIEIQERLDQKYRSGESHSSAASLPCNCNGSGSARAGAMSRRLVKASQTPVLVWPDRPLPPSENGRFLAALNKLEALVQASNDPRKWRYICWIGKLRLSNVDDRVIQWSTICPSQTGALGAAYIVGPCDITLGTPVKQDTIQKSIRSIDDVDKVGQSIGIIAYMKADIVVAVEMTALPLENLRATHDNVQMAIDKLGKWANNPMGGSSAMPTAYVSIKDWIGRRQRDPKSLYSAPCT